MIISISHFSKLIRASRRYAASTYYNMPNQDAHVKVIITVSVNCHIRTYMYCLTVVTLH